MDTDRQTEIDTQREIRNDMARRRQWTIGEGKADAKSPTHYDLITTIDDDENGRPLTRNQRRMLAALDKKIAKAEKLNSFKDDKR